VKKFEPYHAACGFLICSKNCFGFMMARDFSGLRKDAIGCIG
jgi:hypothetical protein